MKPGNFFIGIIDFFSTLVPGAIATFILIHSKIYESFEQPIEVRNDSTEGWAIFLVLAYVIGHIISAIASLLLDPLYDKYIKIKRASLGEKDGLLKAAKNLKKQQLEKIAKDSNTKHEYITNNFWWANTIVRTKIPAGALEIDSLTAQSKLFRSLVLIIPFAFWWLDNHTQVAYLFFIIILLICVHRFFKLRKDATERSYEYFIASGIVKAINTDDKENGDD